MDTRYRDVHTRTIRGNGRIQPAPNSITGRRPPDSGWSQGGSGCASWDPVARMPRRPLHYINTVLSGPRLSPPPAKRPSTHSDMAASVRPRQIVILCDGTGKNGEFDHSRDQPTTNIWQLYQAIQPVDDDYVEYLPGVGAENEKATTSDLLARTFGHTAVHSIRKIYLTIAREYKDGDCLSLFGYSRGAFIVRKVASLIGAFGLITDQALFDKYWKSIEHKLPGKRNPPRPKDPRRIPISCLGVWDTVGAVRPLVIRETLNLLTLPDNDLPDIVQSAFHAVAYHENRKLFDVALFDGPATEKQRFKQTCFPGSHSDVGGGGEELKRARNPLPELTLRWMMDNMPAAINRRTIKLATEIPTTHRLSSAFHTSPAWKRIPDTFFRREYLPDTDGFQPHRVFKGLPSPNSPYLLDHEWDLIEYEEAQGEEQMPTLVPKKKSTMRRFTDMVRSNTRPAPAPISIPVPPMSSIPSTTEPEPLRRPAGLHTRPDSESTQQTDTTTDEPADTASTPRTSILSIDLEPVIPEECKDDSVPEHEPENERESIVEKKEPVSVPVIEERQSLPAPVVEEEPVPTPVVEKEPVVEKVVEPVVASEPISEKPKSETEKTPPAPVLNPRAKPKKGIIRRIKGFFRKTLCAGR
ncbi:hypothetical protein RhiJN_00265 [Ceratobasidium sp. AG-Ba]|nr:hypothetical protein RhiJN_00265 [Ceratobasidium sp. AG-Ba]QRW01302.1 hypothetical protein RhiLY_00299 [Ceratobasidium sp. AG-Ba]